MQAAFADAGCLYNGSPLAIGGYQINFGPGDPRNVCVVPILGEGTATNNKSHMIALRETVTTFIATCRAGTRISIKTCSKLVVGYFTQLSALFCMH